MELKIHDEFKIVDINSIFPDPENAKEHDDKDLAEKKASLKSFGFVKPIVVGKESNIIIAGNGIYFAALALGFKSVPVVFTDLSPIRAKSYGLADNRLSDNGKYNLEQFNLNIQEIDQWDKDIDWKSLGFENKEIELLLASLNTEITDEGLNQDLPEGNIEDLSEEDMPAKPIKLTKGQRETFESALARLRKDESDFKLSEGRAIELICASYMAG